MDRLGAFLERPGLGLAERVRIAKRQDREERPVIRQIEQRVASWGANVNAPSDYKEAPRAPSKTGVT